MGSNYVMRGMVQIAGRPTNYVEGLSHRGYEHFRGDASHVERHCRHAGGAFTCTYVLKSSHVLCVFA